MKRIAGIVAWVIIALPLLANTITVKSVKGTIEVRRGVSEEWKKVSVGDVLKPEDTMRTGEKSSATIVVDAKRLTVPELTMVDLADFRDMSMEDFLLKLAMQNILAVPDRDDDTIVIPTTTVLHGSSKSTRPDPVEIPSDAGKLQLRGVKVLFDNSFYATSILKTKETLRLYPELKSNIEARLTMAAAFEKMNLYNDALAEYSALSTENLPEPYAQKVEKSIQRIKAMK